MARFPGHSVCLMNKAMWLSRIHNWGRGRRDWKDEQDEDDAIQHLLDQLDQLDDLLGESYGKWLAVRYDFSCDVLEMSQIGSMK